MAAEPIRRDLEQRAWQPGGEEILGSQEGCCADLESDPAVGGQRAVERAGSEVEKAGSGRQAREESQGREEGGGCPEGQRPGRAPQPEGGTRLHSSHLVLSYA